MISIHLVRLRGCTWFRRLVKRLPGICPGLSLTNDQFRIGCALRLSTPVSFAHACLCGTNAYEHGSHALICKPIKSRFTRHQIANDVIRESLKRACIPSTLEPTDLMKNDGRHDGVTMLPWSRGRSIAWGFTCVHRLAASTCPKGDKKAPLLLQPRRPSNDSIIMIFPPVISSNL